MPRGISSLFTRPALFPRHLHVLALGGRPRPSGGFETDGKANGAGIGFGRLAFPFRMPLLLGGYSSPSPAQTEARRKLTIVRQHYQSRFVPLWRRRIPVLVGLGCLLATGTLTALLVSARPQVRLTFGGYQRWPHGALLHLTNGTRLSIRYLAKPDLTPAGSPLLSALQTSDGWSKTPGTLRLTPILNPNTGGATNLVCLVKPTTLAKTGTQLEPVSNRVLKPGQSVAFFVRLEPGAAPRRVGTICLFPQGKLLQKLQPWVSRLKERLGLSATPPGQLEVWCAEALYLPPPPALPPRE